MSDVFISYAREDQARAEQVARGLAAMGLEVFWDTDIPPGQTWSDYIEGKLEKSRAVVVLWSQHSTRSQWVREEARMGRDKSKLIPAVIDGSAPPLGFGEVQAADLTTWQGRTTDAQWTRFANAVFTAARGEAPPPQPQAPPAQQYATSPQPPPSAWRAAPAATSSAGAENLSPIGYVQKCLRLYANGKGRARRAEYWWWALFAFLVVLTASVADVMVSGFNPVTQQANSPILYLIAALGIASPGISVLSRRLHDIGQSGWIAAAAVGTYLLGGAAAAGGMPAGVVLVVLAGLGVLVAALIPSRPGENQYGPNPKGV